MSRHTVDLTSHLNQSITRGHPADFPVAMEPLFYGQEGNGQLIPHRQAVVRTDTGQAVAVVSDRYALVPHQRILDTVERAIRPLDVGPVPRGIYVDRQGARMRAIYKFPAMAQPVTHSDEICPCLQIRNTYDGSARIAIHIGAFRFVCTNLAVGGGGVFAGGFMSIHAGEIPIDAMGGQLSAYLSGFDQIVTLYGAWAEQRVETASLQEIFDRVLDNCPAALWKAVEERSPATVYDAYNAFTWYATHQMRSYRTAFDLLERINHGFQKSFPASRS